MNKLLTATAVLATLAAPVFAEGDIDKGEKAFKKCKACHTIEADDGTVIMKGGKTGPNLYGVIGRTAGTYEGFKFGNSIIAAGEAGVVWDEETLAKYTADPKEFLKEATGDGAAKSKMSFKLKKGGEDVAAYLASVAPAPEPASE
ncbi:Cytochrome c551 [Thalassovita gelatinovora]|uniref:Cytochrome c551 n=1 Tax=Thalassovita gelatinovora TaxID=53501 RepID=A0A0P1FWX6_THAGE|nr:c-type cytochrome [Thalassovita gelatinovora]QIZ82303.1 c-type cytochrome [Thalassovita gelatinovora]CUH63875.1 Cytochrome c551 [Thalassovita gelatinovora]SEQ96283.1 cytochrome c [Thalassovita gelatinovora]